MLVHCNIIREKFYYYMIFKVFFSIRVYKTMGLVGGKKSLLISKRFEL